MSNDVFAFGLACVASKLIEAENARTCKLATSISSLDATMRLTAATALLGASLMAGDVALAFVAPAVSNDLVASRAAPSVPLRMAAADDKPKKKLSVADIMAGGNKKAEQDGPGEVKASDNFSEDILADMQSCLQKLEKRAKEGPGSLSMAEVTDLETAMGRIVSDMDLKLQQGASSAADAADAVVDTDASTDVAKAPGVSESKPAAETTTAKATPPPPPDATHEDEDEEIIDTSNDEGPKWDGKGGLGMAKGTRSTYVIPGMEEMTGEEYRKALQKSVSDRQEQRRQSRSGVVGNRAAHDYLNDLGWGGASESLAASGASTGNDSAPKKSHNPFNGPAKSYTQQSSPPPPPPTQPTDWSKFSQPDPVIHHGSQRTSDTAAIDDGGEEIIDTSNDEGPKWDGKGGLGMAKGTRSTYVIPGMEEMTGEEYRKALQKSVSERQEQRRKARGGVVGNRAGHDYLASLGWGGASESLAASSDESDQAPM